jgi:hypothetical protein
MFIRRIASRRACSPDYTNFQDGPFQPSRLTALHHNTGESLVVVLPLSLRLWTTILAGTASLVSAVLP